MVLRFCSDGDRERKRERKRVGWEERERRQTDREWVLIKVSACYYEGFNFFRWIYGCK